MYRPQMINPETHQLVDVYSKVFHTLLDKGYTEDELLTGRVETNTKSHSRTIPIWIYKSC